MSAPQDLNIQAPPPPPFQPPPPPDTPEAEPQAPRAKQLWPIAIGVFVLGLIFVVGGAAKFLSGGLGTGVILCIFGIVLFALSFIRRPLVADAERPLSWFEKITGIFYEPARVFRNLRVYPYWIGAFLTIWDCTTIDSTAFIQRITPKAIVDHTVEKMSQMVAVCAATRNVGENPIGPVGGADESGPARRRGAEVRGRYIYLRLYRSGTFVTRCVGVWWTNQLLAGVGGNCFMRSFRWW